MKSQKVIHLSQHDYFIYFLGVNLLKNELYFYSIVE